VDRSESVRSLAIAERTDRAGAGKGAEEGGRRLSSGKKECAARTPHPAASTVIKGHRAQGMVAPKRKRDSPPPMLCDVWGVGQWASMVGGRGSEGEAGRATRTFIATQDILAVVVAAVVAVGGGGVLEVLEAHPKQVPEPRPK
jgi:hypothetical protein